MGAIETIEADENFAPLLEKVRGGAEVVLTRNGVPVARIVAADPWDRTTVKNAITKLRENRKETRLSGLSARTLIEEGRH